MLMVDRPGLNSTRRICLVMLGAILGSLTMLVIPADNSYATGPPITQQESSFQKGVSYAAWWSGHYSAPGADLSLQQLQSTGANWIALIVTGHQQSYTSAVIDRAHESTPTDADLIQAIEMAHSMGLKVMLKPHVDLFDEVLGGHWRGDIGTGFTTEAQWSAWFTAYRAFINHYANLAQTYGADQFCIGTELLGTTHRAGDWRAIVAGVRAIYDGPIVYAALKEGEDVSITWWDAVDYIGVDGYYILNTDTSIHPTVEELEAAWAGPKATLANLSATWDKPILLTEIGYRSHHGCTSHPWDWWTDAEVDPEEQANAYEATFRQVYNEPWLGGMFWWVWSPNRFSSGPCDDGFSPHLKPAENILRAWYGGTPPPPEPAFFADHERTLDIYADELAVGWQNWSWWTTTLDMAATDQPSSGTQSISVTLQPWGALSLWHPAFDTNQYHWLEFYIRGSFTDDQHVIAFLTTEDGAERDRVPVDDCRHIEGGTIEETWKMVRIPLSDLNRSGLRVTRLTIQDQSSQGSSFWIDNLRLVGATSEPSSQLYLPLVIHNRP